LNFVTCLDKSAFPGRFQTPVSRLKNLHHSSQQDTSIPTCYEGPSQAVSSNQGVFFKTNRQRISYTHTGIYCIEQETVWNSGQIDTLILSGYLWRLVSDSCCRTEAGHPDSRAAATEMQGIGTSYLLQFSNRSFLLEKDPFSG